VRCDRREIVGDAAPAAAAQILARWQAHPLGRDAALIGRIEAGAPRVLLETGLGGRRILDELEDDPLPRIC
jgi:hydrogenase expression/formation protein HypE